MNKEIDLLSYLPLFVQDYREIQAITNVDSDELQKLSNQIYVTKENQFITTCDGVGISRFERLLNIMPDESDSLEERIKKVLIIWNDSIIYTYKGLIKILNDRLGKNNYSCELKYNEYTFVLELKLKNKKINEFDIYTRLRQIIPANIVLNLEYKINDCIFYNDSVKSFKNRLYTVGTIYKTGTVYKQQYTGAVIKNNIHLNNKSNVREQRQFKTKEIRTGGVKSDTTGTVKQKSQ